MMCILDELTVLMMTLRPLGTCPIMFLDLPSIVRPAAAIVSRDGTETLWGLTCRAQRCSEACA